MTTGSPEASKAILETREGPVTIHAVKWPDEQPYVILHNLAPGPEVLLRLQAQCLTSTAFAGQMCDCREQIDAGVRLAATTPGGTMVYLPQEGRGHGLLSKVEIMARMNLGLTLTEAQAAVGRPESKLSYHRIPDLLRLAELAGPVVLLTESPEKMAAARAAGVEIVRTAPIAA